MVKEYATREIKVETIRRSVEVCSNLECPLPAKKEKLIGESARWWGTARRTTIEYLNELVQAEKIVIDGVDVWTWERWQKILDTKTKAYVEATPFKTIYDELSKKEQQNVLEGLKNMPQLGDK